MKLKINDVTGRAVVAPAWVTPGPCDGGRYIEITGDYDDVPLESLLALVEDTADCTAANGKPRYIFDFDELGGVILE